MDVTYLDHNASYPLQEEFLRKLSELAKLDCANPSSLHRAGRRARRLISESTEALSKLIDCDAEFVYWTSGASEANSWAIHSAAELARRSGRNPRLLYSAIEHDSVSLAMKAQKELGAHVEVIQITSTGQIDLNHLEDLFRTPCDLASIMHANNETGVLQPLEQASQLAKRAAAPLHIDCVQALGRTPVSVRTLGARYTTFSGHKLGAIKGAGALVVQGEGRILAPIVHGKQQKALRGGTENALAIGHFGHVLQAMLNNTYAPFPEHLECLHRDFEEALSRRIEGTVVHGAEAPRLRNTSFVGFRGVDGDGLVMGLDLEGVCVSSGSACTSGSIDPSHVLLAMNCDKSMARSSVRITSGASTTKADFQRVLELLPELVDRVRGARG